MIKIMALVLAFICVASTAALPGAAESDSIQFSVAKIQSYGDFILYVLDPGLYKIGDVIPQGSYDVRISEGETTCTLTYSELFTENGALDMDFFYSYTVSIESKQWPGGAHPVIFISNCGYLLVEGKTCRLYSVPMGH